MVRSAPVAGVLAAVCLGCATVKDHIADLKHEDARARADYRYEATCGTK